MEIMKMLALLEAKKRMDAAFFNGYLSSVKAFELGELWRKLIRAADHTLPERSSDLSAGKIASPHGLPRSWKKNEEEISQLRAGDIVICVKNSKKTYYKLTA